MVAKLRCLIDSDLYPCSPISFHGDGMEWKPSLSVAQANKFECTKDTKRITLPKSSPFSLEADDEVVEGPPPRRYRR